jgi:hypothetical protein
MLEEKETGDGRTWSVKVLGSDLGQESNSLSDKLAVDLVQVVRTLLERDWLDRGKVVWSTTLVVECHLTISLEIAHLEGADRLVDGQLLVVGSDSVSVGIGVGE